MFFRENFTLKNMIFLMLIVCFLLFIAQTKEIALLFFGSYVIACSINPVVDKLSKHMNRALATSIVLGSILITIIVICIPIIGAIYSEIQELINTFPAKFHEFEKWIETTVIFGQSLKGIINIDTVIANSTEVTKTLLDKSINITVGIIEGITVVFSVAMIVFYLVYEKNSIKHSVLRLYPPKIRRKAQEITNIIEEKVGSYVVAQGLSMLTVGLFTGLGLCILKVNYSILLGLIAGVFDIIPIIGPTVALIMGIAAAASKGWIFVALTIFVYLLSQWISNQFVRPILFGKFLNLHPVAVIFAFLVAAKFLGVWGVILAPAIASLIAVLFDELYIKTINKDKDESF